MQRKIHPAVGGVIIAVVAALVLYFGFKTTLGEPESVVGIGRDGRPMTREDANRMAEAMSGGKYKAPAQNK
jgi:hypothetical protein